MTDPRHCRSVVTKLTTNGIYKFVEETDTNKVWASDTVPANISNLDDNRYYLTLVNKRTINEEEEDIPETETYEVHLATVVTGSDGQIAYIKWLKRNDAGTEVDQRYLDHTLADEGETAGVHPVKVIKDGTYYWIETKAPSGYSIDSTAPKTFTKTTDTLDPALPIEFTDTKLPEPDGASVLFTKTAKEQVGSYGIGDGLQGATFKLVDVKESLNKSRLTAQHSSRLHLFRHLAPNSLENRQVSCAHLIQSDEKSDCAI